MEEQSIDNWDYHNDLKKTQHITDVEVVGKGKECHTCGGARLKRAWGHWSDRSRIGWSGLGDCVT